MNESESQELDSAFFEQMVEAVGVGVAIYGAEGFYRYVNDAYAELLGTGRDELIGRGVWEVVPAFEQAQFAAYWDSFGEDETRATETVHEFEGTEVPVATVTTQRTIAGQPYHFGTIRDITELRQREDELERQNERLEAFAGIVAHDLRNPLNVAMSYLELLDQDTDREEVTMTKSALSRMEGLIEDLLTLAKQGGTPDSLERVSVESVVLQAWRTVETKDASLETLGDVQVDADSGQLRQVFENLIHNAIEHGGDTVSITVGPRPDGRGFFVADDGDGIPPEDRNHIFEPGYTSSDDGTGFGLIIVSDIVEAHDWTIEVTESDSGGARFDILVDTAA